MANEGFLGSHKLSGERCTTDDHPVMIHALPLAESVTGELAPGLLLKRADTGAGGTDKVAYAPWLSTDTAPVVPVAVVDDVCPAGSASAICVMHGCVKTRMLKSGDGKAPTDIQIADLAQRGIFAV